MLNQQLAAAFEEIGQRAFTLRRIEGVGLLDPDPGQLSALLRHRAVPVVNENDTVSVDELKLGDNDNLAAIVAALVDADVLFIATDIDGLYDADPRKNPDARPVEVVPQLTPALLAAAGGSGSQVGTGGMRTKLEAAQRAQAQTLYSEDFSHGQRFGALAVVKPFLG